MSNILHTALNNCYTCQMFCMIIGQHFSGMHGTQRRLIKSQCLSLQGCQNNIVMDIPTHTSHGKNKSAVPVLRQPIGWKTTMFPVHCISS